MKTVSPFNYLKPPKNLVPVTFDGQEYLLPEGADLASALLAAGVRSLRNTPVSGEPRAPFCMMGSCFECLVLIDGVTHQACMTEVSSGLVVERMKPINGAQDD